tara:strand:- start:224 stop:541 length:318 start_codon:yes stop_codon:yes gene_type:complete
VDVVFSALVSVQRSSSRVDVLLLLLVLLPLLAELPSVEPLLLPDPPVSLEDSPVDPPPVEPPLESLPPPLFVWASAPEARARVKAETVRSLANILIPPRMAVHSA